MSPGHGDVPRPGAVAVSLQFLLDIAHQKNRTPLPLIKPYSGPPDCPQLPPEIPAEEGEDGSGIGDEPPGVGRGFKLQFSTALKGGGEYWPVHVSSEVSRLDLQFVVG